MIRDLEISDLMILEENNTIPKLYDGPFKILRAIEYKGELIGAFWVRITTESSLIFKARTSPLTRALALDEMIKFLYDKVPEELGISDSFVIFENHADEKYVNYLKKHYSLEDITKALRMRRNDAQ